MLKLIPPGKRGKYYIVRGTVGGRRFERSTKTTEKLHAQELRLQWETEFHDRKIYGAELTTTFAEAVNLYLGAGRDDRFLDPLLEHFQVTLLKDITYTKVMEAAQNIYPGRKPSTINRQVITPISAIMTLAHSAGMGPSRSFPRFKEPKGKIRWLTPVEADTLIEAASGNNDLQHIILFLLGSGARLGEALKLTPRNLHLASREAFFEKTKTDQPRMCEYPSRTAAAMSTLQTLNDIDTPLFRTRLKLPFAIHGNTGGQISGPFATACKRAGLDPKDVTPHTLRHTWATWYHAATGDFVRLMALGGWKKPDTAMRYTKLAPKNLKDELLKHNWDFSGENRGSVLGSLKLSYTFKALETW